MNALQEIITRSEKRIESTILKALVCLVRRSSSVQHPRVIVLDDDARQRALLKKFERQAGAWRKIGLTINCA